MLEDMSGEKRAAIAGVTGLVGDGLAPLLVAQGYSVTGISRAGTGDVPGVSSWQKPDALDLSGHHAVINLAGEPVNQRWTEERKKRFRESRVNYTEKLVAAIGQLPHGDRPEVLVNASAVGYYGHRGDEFLTEAAEPGAGYLADLCRDWEDAAMKAEKFGVRVVKLRIGLVLGRKGGAYRQLRGIFRLGVGGRLGGGRQWMPWIHLEDLQRGIVHSVVSRSIHGAVNGTAPSPERNSDFTKKFAIAMDRPALLPVPGFALKAVFGEFAQALLDSSRAVPSALVADGFSFKFSSLEEALADLTG
jgi:uncharacterized protein (TIGR01777 family)